MVPWIAIALLAGLGAATADALVKKFFSGLTPYEMGLARLLYALPLMALIFFFVPWPETDLTFWICIGIALPLEISAFLIYMKALKIAPLSTSIPFLAFTPVFVILTGWIILGEQVSFGGVAGILVIVAGSYVLHLSKLSSGWSHPFRAAFNEPGSRYMILISFIYSITSSVGKMAIIHSEPMFFGMIYSILMTAVVALMWPFSKARPASFMARPAAGIILGLAVVFTVVCHMVAISRIEAAYMISIKRTSLLFSVLYGALWFKEEKMRERFAGALLMLAGIFLIGFFT
jgi:drug/metabolite transporter (DMT)-like permease